MAFNRELSQFASYLALDASARYIGITTAVDANVGIGSVTPKSKLDVVGDALISGITTSTGGFVGDLTGTASNATQAEGLTGTPNLTVNTVTAAHINNTGVVTSSGGFVGDVTGDVVGNVTGDVTGNADSATALETARTIGGVSFDGSANINLPGVNQSGNQDTSGNAATATALETARTIGGVSFDGSANINLPGVNATGNQDTSGNAATATALETARNFTVSGDATTDSAQSFDGSGNVALPITLANSGVSAATYGSGSAVPVITVDAKGRITSATTAAVGSALTVTGDSGSEQIDLLTEGLAITGNGNNVITAASGNAVDITLNPNVAITDLSASGVVTATSFHTGDAGSSIQVNSETITGPSSITIDPSAIGDNTGTVHILGNLQVEGTTTTIDSTTVNIADKNIQIATGAANDAAADGGGITVDSGDGDKTFQFQATGDNFGSSENMNLASGKVYKVNNVEVLSATTLGSNVSNSSLTSVGTLDSLNVAGAITGDNINLSGIVTASSFVATNGVMNITGDVTGTATTATNAEGLTGTPSITVQDITGTGNINIAGVITASSFVGDGSGLTGVASTDNIQTATPARFLNNVTITGITTVGVVTSGTSVSATDIYGVHHGAVIGNADTATALETARTIGGVSFDGSANINLPGVNQEGNQDTTGNAATATVATNAQGLTGTPSVTVNAVTSAHINNTGVVTASGGFVGDLTGTAQNATQLASARNFTVTGDATTDSAQSFDGSANVALPITLANSGVSAATYGSGSAVPVITVDAKGRITSATTAAVGSGLTVAGDTGSEDISLLSETLTISGGSNLTSNAASNGVTVDLNDDISIVTAAVSGVVTASGGFVGNVTGNVTGNADSATALENARNIGGVSFDGTANIDLPGVNTAGNQDTSGNAATATVATNAQGLTGTPNVTVNTVTSAHINNSGVTTSASFVGALTGNVVGNVTGDVTGNADTASTLETARTIGGVSFDGSSNINLPGVNQAGNQDTSGNAATATALETSRTLALSGDATGSASFDGSANATIAATLANSGVSAGTFGSASAIPVLTVDAKGRVTSATTTAVGSGLTVTGDSGSEDIDLLTEGLAITGGTNLTSSAASNGVELSLDADVALTNLSASGVVTATSFKTGTEGSSIHINSATITGPSSITLDPAGIGDNTGVVHILGDLQVEGTTTTIDSTTVNIADKNIQVGTGAVNDAAADGAGFTIDSGDGDKTFQYENTGDNFGSSENMNLASGKVYKINNTEVLSATTLGSAVVNSSLTSVGTLDSLNVAGALTGAHINASGIVTASSFSGSGSGLSAGTTPLTTLDIDGATDIGADLSDGDLIVVDDGAGGTNRKSAMSRVKEYVLGGGSGGNFEQLSVTGISTLGEATATGLVVSGVTTATGGVVGNLTGDVTGNADTATTLETARTIGGVSFDGSANINLPGVNQAGNQDTTGNAATATALETARTLAISGDASGSASFDGSANATISATLANTGVSAATYGSTTAVPVLTVDSKGRITSATTAAVGSALTVTGDSGSEDIDLLSEGLAITGGDNLTSSAASNGVAISLDNDISITTAAVSGVVTAGGGFVGDVTGDLTGDVTSTGLISAAHINASGVTTATGGFVGNVKGNINSTGLSTVTNLEVGGYVSIGDTHGQMNQVLSSVGAGVTWKSITDVLPQTRTTQTSTATAGQTTFSFNYNVNYLDVFVNGVKLSSSELTATNGTSVVISEALFEGDIVEFHSYATAGAGSGTVSSANDLTDITLSSASNNDILVYNGSAFVNQQSLNLSGNIAAADLTLSGDLTVNGTTTTLNTATLNVEDLNITVANGAANAAAADGAGLTVDGASATFQYASTGDKWVANKSIEATSFIGDGSGLTGVASTDNIQTATEAEFLSGVKIAGVTTASGGIVGNVTGNVSGSSGSCTGNAATATALETARTIGGVSFDGTSGINLPGVNQSGNQDTSGNAATATALETARNIGGVSFNGSADINLPGVNISGNQNTSGTAAGLSGTPSITVNAINSSHINSSGIITATSFSGDGSGLTGVASTDNIRTATSANFLSHINVAGVTTATNKIEIRSDDSTPGRMDFYCETSNAHYTRLQSQAHANYSGNVTLTLPKVSGTAIVGGSNSNDTNITTTGDVSAANFNSTSDITLKDNVSIIDNALDMINNLEGISWNWKNNGKASLGVSAQNVETVAPELVNTSETHKSVNYNGLIGILIEAVKEQGNQISELRTELAKKANSRKKRS